MQVVGPFLLITYGEQYIASSLTGILIAAAPIFTSLLAMRFDQDERPRGIAAAGIVVGILGVALLFGVDLRGDGTALAAGLMVLLAAFGYAISGFYVKHRLRGMPPVGIAAGTVVVAARPVAGRRARAAVSVPSLKAIASMLALGAGGTGIAFLIFYTLMTTSARPVRRSSRTSRPASRWPTASGCSTSR